MQGYLRSRGGGESGADEFCSRPRGREIQHAERSAFFVRITTLSERKIKFQATTRSAREISICFENRFGFGKIEALPKNILKQRVFFNGRNGVRK